MREEERWEGAITTKGKRRRKGGRPGVGECLSKERRTKNATGTVEVAQKRKGMWKREGAFRMKCLLCNNHASTRPSTTRAWQRSMNNSNYY